MSIQLMNQVWDLELSSSDKFVLLSLADQANDSGVCWPSLPMIAKRCGLTERGVINIIARLVESGLLSKSMRAGTSTQYTITPEPRSPLNTVHPTPERYSPPPLNTVHPTPEPRSPKPSITTTRTTKNHLPDWLPKAEWEAFKKMRNKIRKPMTDEAERLTIMDLDALRKQGDDPKLVLEKSIKNSWQGVFEINKGAKQKPKQTGAIYV